MSQCLKCDISTKYVIYMWDGIHYTCQSEGGFGVMKYDMLYDRFRRIGIDQVTLIYIPFPSALLSVVVVLVQFLRCKSELGHGEKAVLGIDVVRIRDRIQIHTVAVFSQVFILDMA